MKEYENIKGKLVASIKNNMIQRKIILNEQRQIDLPAVKDLAAGIDSSKIKISKTFPGSKVPLSFVNEIITAELHIDKFEKSGAKSFKLTVSNKGTAVSYNAKCIVYKHSTAGLKEVSKSAIFYLGIDEIKEVIINVVSSISGQYYAVIHDPILDTFPFSNIDDLIKDRTPFPNSSAFSNVWKAFRINGTSFVINPNFWFRCLIKTNHPYDRSFTPPQNEQLSEIRSNIVVPGYLNSSLVKGKLSLKIKFNFFINKDTGVADTGHLRLERPNLPPSIILLSNLNSFTPNSAAGPIINPQGIINPIYQSNKLSYSLDNQSINVCIQIKNNGGRKNGRNPNDPPNLASNPGPNGIFIRYLESYFIHRQMKGYPNI